MWTKALKHSIIISLHVIGEQKNKWVEIIIIIWMLKCHRFFQKDLVQNETIPSIVDKYEPDILSTSWHVALHQEGCCVDWFAFYGPIGDADNLHLPFSRWNNRHVVQCCVQSILEPSIIRAETSDVKSWCPGNLLIILINFFTQEVMRVIK